VDLLRALEKIIIERRTHVIQVEELIPATPADVRLGELYVEYEKPADRTAVHAASRNPSPKRHGRGLRALL